jgi:hypothetical protein
VTCRVRAAIQAAVDALESGDLDLALQVLLDLLEEAS